MRYFADFMRDEVYAVDENGNGKVKRYIQHSLRPLKFDIKVLPFYTSKQPWISEENGVGFFVEEITAEKYASFGEEWLFDPLGGKEALISDINHSLK